MKGSNLTIYIIQNYSSCEFASGAASVDFMTVRQLAQKNVAFPQKIRSYTLHNNIHPFTFKIIII